MYGTASDQIIGSPEPVGVDGGAIPAASDDALYSHVKLSGLYNRRGSPPRISQSSSAALLEQIRFNHVRRMDGKVVVC
jgi:hypothetical protein